MHGCHDSHKIIEKVILIRKSTILSSKLTQYTWTLWFIPEYIIYISQYFSTWEYAMEAHVSVFDTVVIPMFLFQLQFTTF